MNSSLLVRSTRILVSRRISSSSILFPRYFATNVVNKNVNDELKKPLRIERELPDPTKDKYKQRIGFAAFVIAVGSSLALIFNYEKTESPIVVNTLYYLRRSPRTRELLGDNIEFDGIIPWVYGELNQVAGNVNIKFHIKGSNNVSGTVKLIADRKNREEEFLIHQWTLTVGDKQIDLLSEEQ
ncbi:hypothetical protein Kpol_1043p79 [Vanderwaltozyma polyspora DSM 70294]|uniref:Cytochrome c oxidase assembly factor 1 n=1 Tax=Vanderwaltozyma polyspora (strain ATCC 22028 / DSM 70294 / BCRC 21397 / CBS 2163 / NBRC 10782 / NRRL Y-8283 / UCD 57-17) TaxID=436907 RepID=A7TIU6_VANPO|nr:uncharacterized protein Kpol_1043p79 [Vanderwaltozyma polyspora DSM 70294]EDO17888.1 hypothetical protein Kpol_1043p79 [Vanderwaltozyma polyspora DSM 70294]